MSASSKGSSYDKDPKYLCVNFSPNFVGDTVRSNQPSKMWQNKCRELVKNNPMVFQSLESKEFYQFYEAFCDLKSKLVLKGSAPSVRVNLCSECHALKCGRCQHPTGAERLMADWCKDCEIVRKSFGEDASGNPCFLHIEFQKSTKIKLNGMERPFDPSETCHKCQLCTTEACSTDIVVLRDLPMNFHPTEVVIKRPLYARKHGSSKENLCPSHFPDGILHSPNSRLTSRLYAACLQALLESPYHLLSVSEWYCVTQDYLYKMKREQTERVEAKKAALRAKPNKPASCIGFASCVCNDQQIKLYFRVPSCDEGSTRSSMELIGIYSEEELAYLAELMRVPPTWTHLIEIRPDFPSSRVFSMAYDYTIEQPDQSYYPSDILAAILTCLDALLCTPLPDRIYELWALYRQMFDLTKAGTYIQDLLSLAKASKRRIPASLSEYALSQCTDFLIDRLEAIMRTGGNFLHLKPHRASRPLSYEERQYANRIADLIATKINDALNTNGNSPLLFNDIRNDILFFNQAVIPYVRETSERNGAQYHPAFDPYGNFDTSEIHTIGVRCACLTHMLRSNTPDPLPCRSIHANSPNGYDPNFPCDRHCKDE